MVLYSFTELAVHAFTRDTRFYQVTQEALSCRDLSRMDNLIFWFALLTQVYKIKKKKSAEFSEICRVK